MQAYGDQWYVSWYNFEGQEKPADKPFIVHDVTLRDGEQQAGILFSMDEKIEIARALAGMGVDRIEAGMVAVSEEDRQTIRKIVDLGLSSEIWTIGRSTPEDVRQAIESGVAGMGIIILANEQYCKVFRWTPEEAIEKALRAADLAKQGALQTTLLIADSSRMRPELLKQIVSSASDSGLFDAVSLMDTFGALNPEGAFNLVRSVRRMTNLTIELHPHNDFGFGTINAISGLRGGASVIHTSVLGLGERVGNTPLEELAVAAPLLYGLKHNLDLSKIAQVADLVQRHSRMTVSANKPVIGPSYSQIESGTVATEFSRLSKAGEDVQWLFPFDPKLVGRDAVSLVTGKGSGLANIDAILERTNYRLDDSGKRKLLERAKTESIRLHRVLTDVEVIAMAEALAID
jgi:isopropylmalate/homocitrate/citramalate synthase